MAYATAWADSMAGMMPFGARQVLEGVYRFVVGNGDIFCPADIVEPCVLRADAGIVQPCGNGVDRGDLAVLILAEVGLHAVENTLRGRCCYGGGSLNGVDTPSRCLAADQPHSLVLDEIDRTLPMALEPPPTQASHCDPEAVPPFPGSAALISLEITAWKSRTMVGNGCGPMTEPRQ